MWDAISIEIWGHFKGEWGMIAAAPGSFLLAVALATFLVSLVLSRFWAGRSREQRAIMTATIEHQRELLAGHRDREEKDKEQIAEITRTPELRLILLGGNVFVPDDQPNWTGFNISAKVWNTGAPSVTVLWSLVVIPRGQLPVLAQWTNKPDQFRASGPHNSSVMRASDGLDIKTGSTPVHNVPVTGDILFYIPLGKELVTNPETWVEMSVMDIYQKETVAKKKIGDWLQR